MAINKVIYGGETLIDLTGDTVTADKILSGFTAHAMLIFEKIPGGKFRKIFLKGGMEYRAHSLHDCWYHYRNCFRTTGIPKGCRWFAANRSI